MVEDLDDEVLQKFTVLDSKISLTNDSIENIKSIIDKVQNFLTDFIKNKNDEMLGKISEIDAKVELNYKNCIDRIAIEAKYRLRDLSDINLNLSKQAQNIDLLSKRIDNYMVDNSKIK